MQINAAGKNRSTSTHVVPQLMCVIQQVVGVGSTRYNYGVEMCLSPVKCMRFKHSYVPNENFGLSKSQLLFYFSGLPATTNKSLDMKPAGLNTRAT